MSTLLSLPDEILINTIDDVETFQSIKRVSRAHFERLDALEDRFYHKILGYQSYKQLYQSMKRRDDVAEMLVLYQIHFSDAVTGNHRSYRPSVYYFKKPNRSLIIDQLLEWIEYDRMDDQGLNNFHLSLQMINLKSEDILVISSNEFDRPEIYLKGTIDFLQEAIESVRYHHDDFRAVEHAFDLPQ